MVTAIVQLKPNGPASLHVRGYHLRQKTSCTVSREEDVRFFQGHPSCAVQILAGSMPKAPNMETKSQLVEAPPTNKAEAPKLPDVPASDESPPAYTSTDLGGLTKQEIINIGEGEFALTLSMSESKSTLIEKVLAAQAVTLDEGDDAQED